MVMPVAGLVLCISTIDTACWRHRGTIRRLVVKCARNMSLYAGVASREKNKVMFILRMRLGHWHATQVGTLFTCNLEYRTLNDSLLHATT